MESTLGASVCLTCFELTVKHMYVPADAPAKIFSSCNKYLHSTLTQENLKDVQLSDKNQLPLCKSCFDSALELTQLSQQLTNIEKNISDLTVGFSMTVFHRRSQVYSIGQSYKSSSIISFNEACLPPNLFSEKNQDQSIEHNISNQETDKSSLLNHPDINITNVKSESGDTQFNNFPENPQPKIANNNAEMQFNHENIDKHCAQPTVEQNQTLTSIREMRMVDLTGGNDSNKFAVADSKNTAMSEKAFFCKHQEQSPSYRKMEPTLTSRECLICFKMIEKQISVPSAEHVQIVSNCNKYLHSTLIKETLKHIQLNNENQVPLCKSCFDSALELTQLSEQLTTIQKDISDLAITFSMAVFHRRSQVYNLSQMQSNSTSFQNSSTIEFIEACLPPNLFSNETADKIINNYNNHYVIVSNTLNTKTNIANVTLESSDLPFGYISGNSQPLIAKDDEELQCNQDNVEAYCAQATIEHNNIVTFSKTTDVPVPGGNGSKICTRPKNGIQVSMSDLLKSVRMPVLKLDRLKIESFEVGASVVNSYQTQCESRETIIDVTLNQTEEISEPSYAPSSSDGEELLKCLYCEMTFAHESYRILHHKNHAMEKPFECSFCTEKFVTTLNRKIHERMHTGSNPFKCLYCDKSFPTKFILQNHKRTHTGEKPFICSFCEKCFATEVVLKNHRKIHTGETPYKCLYCEKSFKQLVSKNIHQKTHIKENQSVNDNLIVGI